MPSRNQHASASAIGFVVSRISFFRTGTRLTGMVARAVLGHNRSEAKGGGERLSGMRNSVSRPWLISFANMKRRSDSWKEKVHPLFIEIAGVYRDSVKEWLALGQPPAEKAAQV